MSIDKANMVSALVGAFLGVVLSIVTAAFILGGEWRTWQDIKAVHVGGHQPNPDLSAFVTTLDLDAALEESRQISKLIPTLTLQSDRTPKTRGAALGVAAGEGFCVLSLITGRYDAYAERVGVYINNGQWVYDFNHGAARIGAHIDCYGIK